MDDAVRFNCLQSAISIEVLALKNRGAGGRFDVPVLQIINRYKQKSAPYLTPERFQLSKR